MGFLSAGGDGRAVEVFSAGAGEVLGAAGRAAVAPPASDMRFAGAPMVVFFFSSPGAADLPFSSVEVSDMRGRWELVTPVAAGVLDGGFRTVVAGAVGRAGGLLSVLPVVDRAAVVPVGFATVDVLGGVGFAPVTGRFGGTVVLARGELAGPCSPAAVASGAGGVSAVGAMAGRGRRG